MILCCPMASIWRRAIAGRRPSRRWSPRPMWSACDCPLTAENANLIDARALEAFKKGAFLINTARGGLVDLGALETALRDGQLGGAGLDVLPAEPPDPSHPLISAFRRREPWLDGRLLLTPHVAWLSPDGRADLRRKSAETVRDYLVGGRLRNCVNQAWLEAAGRPGEP